MKGTIAILAAIIVAGCGKPAETKHASASAAADLPLVQVTLAEAALRTAPRFEEVVGTARARLRATIEAKTSGRIENLPVRLGQPVKQGELLVKLDAQEIEARADQAAAARAQAETELGRLTVLLKQEALTQAEFDAAQARFRMADAALREVRTMLGYATVAAPFDGVVVKRFADVGDLAAPGKPLLELEDPAQMRFVAAVPETLIGRLKIGAELEVRLQGGGEAARGTVVEIAPTGDAVSRTTAVELDLSGGARSGAFGRLMVPAADDPMLLVPASAVQARGQMEVLFVARDGRAELRLVRTGKRFGADLEVLSGVKAGERVVAEGMAELRDGQPIAMK